MSAASHHSKTPTTQSKRRSSRSSIDPTDQSYLAFLGRPKEERQVSNAVVSLTRLFHHRTLRTPKGRIVTLPDGDDLLLLLKTWVLADYRLLASLLPQYGRRYRLFLRRLWRDYRIRRAKDPEKAGYWLLSEITKMRLPDLRQGKTHLDDFVLLQDYDALKEAFAGIFHARRFDPSSGEMFARLATEALGRPINDLPVPGQTSLSEYCQIVLRTNAVTLSRARRRLRQDDRERRRTLAAEMTAALQHLRNR